MKKKVLEAIVRIAFATIVALTALELEAPAVMWALVLTVFLEVF